MDGLTIAMYLFRSFQMRNARLQRLNPAPSVGHTTDSD